MTTAKRLGWLVDHARMLTGFPCFCERGWSCVVYLKLQNVCRVLTTTIQNEAHLFSTSLVAGPIHFAVCR